MDVESATDVSLSQWSIRLNKSFMIGILIGAASGLAPEIARGAYDFRKDPGQLYAVLAGLFVFGVVVIFAASFLKEG